MAVSKVPQGPHHSAQLDVLLERSFAANAALADVCKDSVLVVRGPSWRARELLFKCKVTLPHEAGALVCRAYEHLQPALGIMRRRRAAGTLLPGACRSYEVAYARAVVRILREESGFGTAAPTLLHDVSGQDFTGLMIGYHQFTEVAFIASLVASTEVHRLHALRTLASSGPQLSSRGVLLHLPAGFDINTAPGLTRDALADCISFACDALDLQAEGSATGTEAGFNSDARFNECVHELLESTALQSVAAADALLWQPLRDAWTRAQHAAAERQRSTQDHPVFDNTANIFAAAEARAPARRSLRACAHCGAREREAAQFKRCSACGSVVYCTKACLTAAWPVHKATCKVLRRAAASGAAAGSAPP